MIRKIFFTGLVGLYSYSFCLESKMASIIKELNNGMVVSPNSHSSIHGLVDKMAKRYGMETPKIYITTAWTEITDRDTGIKRSVLGNIEPYVDLSGVLHLKIEALRGLTYKELKGAIALGLAYNELNVGSKMFGVGAVSWLATVGSVIGANYIYNLDLGKVLFQENKFSYAHRSNRTELQDLVLLSAVPAILAAAVCRAYLTRGIDKKASAFTSKKNVALAIKGLARVKHSLVGKSFFHRMTSKLKLKGALRTLFYPVRDYTKKERLVLLESVEQLDNSKDINIA